jgi:hypothetical protein
MITYIGSDINGRYYKFPNEDEGRKFRLFWEKIKKK